MKEQIKRLLHAKSFRLQAARFFLYAVYGIIVMTLEFGFFSHFCVHGAQPVLLYGLVAGIAFFEGERQTAIYGALLGLISGILMGQSVLFLPLTLAVTGYFCGLFSRNLFRHWGLTWLYTVLIGLGIQCAVTVIWLSLRWLDFVPLTILKVASVEMLLSLSVCIFLYYPLLWISRVRTGKPVY